MRTPIPISSGHLENILVAGKHPIELLLAQTGTRTTVFFNLTHLTGINRQLRRFLPNPLLEITALRRNRDSIRGHQSWNFAILKEFVTLDLSQGQSSLGIRVEKAFNQTFGLGRKGNLLWKIIVPMPDSPIGLIHSI